MKIAFTLCSFNYMAQAKTLADSFREQNPEWHFVIGLVDKVNGRLPESYWHPYELIEVEKIGIDGFEEMCEVYDIVELNTSVKPFYMEYLFNRDKDVELVAYFDPDIMFFGTLDDLENKMCHHDVFLTPHFFKPVSEESFIALEQLCLWVGVYNLGFIALKRGNVANSLLNWWMKRLRKFCFRNLGNQARYRGFFVDQVWIDFVPVFFGNPILLHEGHNVAYWNLMERKITLREGKFIVNDSVPLIFFHFSSYNPFEPEKIGRYWSEKFSLQNDECLKKLFTVYREKFLENGHEQISKQPCLLIKHKKVQKYPKYETGLFGEIKYRVKILLTMIHRLTERYAYPK